MTWSNFTEDVEKHVISRGGCGVCRLLAEVDEADAKEIQAVLDNPAFSGRAIHDAFKAREVPIGRDKIDAHRRGRCS